MKSEEPTEQALSQVLREWQVPSELPPRFSERVWQRIERQEAAPAAGRWDAGWLTWLGSLQLRPALAVTYATVLVLGGLLAGSWQARLENARTAHELGSRYVRMMAAYEMPSR